MNEQNQDAVINKVMARVRKMMALANDAAASQGERDNAMRMALNVLAKHNLTMAQTEAATHTQAEKRIIDGSSVTVDFPWARRAAFAIAKLYFCGYYFNLLGKGKQRHTFVGREGNAETARLMSEYVIKSILREASARSKKEFEPSRWARAFCKGASDEVTNRCYALRKEAERDSESEAQSTGTSLVLASHYLTEQKANDAFIAERVGKLRQGVNRERGAGAGYGEGQAYGRTVSLNKQVGNGNAAASATQRIK